MSKRKQGNDSSLVDTFHRVSSLVPPDQQLTTIGRETTVGEALKMMASSNYSQLPIVAGNDILGVFSYRSFSQKAAERQKQKRNLVLADQLVIDFMEDFPIVFPTMDWTKVQRYLDEKDGFFVDDDNGLPGLVTTMDVFEYFREIADPFILIAEIEVTLRRLIGEQIPEEQHAAIFERCLAGAYPEGKVPTKLRDLSLANYINIITSTDHWYHFEAIFGGGDGVRRSAARRLAGLDDLRNIAFHFRRQLEPHEREKLADCRNWLDVSIRGYEGESQRNSIATEWLLANPNYMRLRAAFTPADEAFFSWLLTELNKRADSYAIRWNKASFSVQRRRPDQQPVSFAYGWQGQFDVYFGYLDLSAEELARWRTSLLTFGVFAESGKHTLKAKPTDVAIDRLQDACIHLLDVLAKGE